MRSSSSTFIVLFLVVIKNSSTNGQLSFSGGGTTTTTTTTTQSTTDPTVDTRANGLLASQLGLNPLGNSQNSQNSAFTNQGGSNSGGEQPAGRTGNSCCCAPGNFCPNPRDYNGGGGFIDAITPRITPAEATTPSSTNVRQAAADPIEEIDIGVRIVNNPESDPIQRTCPSGYRRCCYEPQDVGLFGSNCIPSNQIDNNVNVFWKQGCRETFGNSGQKTCGQRKFTEIAGLRQGEANPEEFPWTCIMLTDQNRFLGGCAIVPERTDNSISRGTKRVITAAHKLKSLKANEGLKVRIIEYDASAFNTNLENTKHQELFVTRFVKHPRFDPKRLSDDIAVLILEKPINLRNQNGVNAGCYPRCNDMFNYEFNNGTGVRCWVAGWGRTEEKDKGGEFSFIQRKVDVPIYNRNRCEVRLRQELTKANVGNRNFQLHSGEICAGGETGKDSCEGDGGSPLVCQSINRRWHVVGLVAWGIGCANRDVPGVYVNVYHYLDFITDPAHGRSSG